MKEEVFEGLILSLDGPIAKLQLNYADKGNAFDELLHSEFAKVLKALRENGDIRVILLHAAGRLFSAGGDLGYIQRLHDDPDLRRRTHREGYDIFTALTEMHVPIVVAVQGHAVGFGATIATACDVVVAWKGAKLGDPHVQVGLVAGDGGVLSWSAAAGYNRARRLLLTGDTLSAVQAYEFGLVTDLVDEPSDALKEATRIAEQIAALPPIAVQGTKQAFNALARVRNGNVLDLSLTAEIASVASEDINEALNAIQEKRTGIYHNR